MLSITRLHIFRLLEAPLDLKGEDRAEVGDADDGRKEIEGDEGLCREVDNYLLMIDEFMQLGNIDRRHPDELLFVDVHFVDEHGGVDRRVQVVKDEHVVLRILGGENRLA